MWISSKLASYYCHDSEAKQPLQKTKTRKWRECHFYVLNCGKHATFSTCMLPCWRPIMDFSIPLLLAFQILHFFRCLTNDTNALTISVSCLILLQAEIQNQISKHDAPQTVFKLVNVTLNRLSWHPLDISHLSFPEVAYLNNLTNLVNLN